MISTAQTITIRSAQPEDATAMGHVMVNTWLAAHRDHTPPEAWEKRVREWTPDVSARGWRAAINEIVDGTAPDNCLYIAQNEAGEIVGIAYGYPVDEPKATGEISALYVATSVQGCGIGRRLVQTVANHLATHGAAALQIAVLAANTPARGFYEALGGQVIDEREFNEAGFMLPKVVYGWPDIQTLIQDQAKSRDSG